MACARADQLAAFTIRVFAMPYQVVALVAVALEFELQKAVRPFYPVENNVRHVVADVRIALFQIFQIAQVFRLIAGAGWQPLRLTGWWESDWLRNVANRTYPFWALPVDMRKS